ncbi:DUF6356 family protein [Hwanghaeella sp.]|uniref:DUF6356 family protein n=1 Tax=Hwanghaeella sp. TaxID=2605943 RepID=UPI003CCB9FA0
MKNLFTDHPNSVGEDYVEHMGQAMGFALPLFLAACACLAHAFLPFLFEKTGSRIITDLHDRMVANRVRHKNMHKVLPAPAE